MQITNRRHRNDGRKDRAVFRELGAFDLAFHRGLMGREWHFSVS